MYLNRSLLISVSVCILAGCSSGFLGLAPMGDRKEYIQARSSFEQGNYQAAVTQLSDYIYKTKNVKRREARAYRLLGQSYEKLGQPDRALEVYLEALEFHPDNVPLLLEAARLYQQNALTNRSMEMYERALKEEPNNLAALAGQAANYTALGFYSKARTFYDRFFTLSPTISPYYRALYAATFLHQRNYEQAFIHITLALEAEPTNPDFWLLSAKARRGLHRNHEACADLETALTLAPNRTDLLGYKALWLYGEGRYAQSLQTAGQLLRQNPASPLAQLVQALNWRKQGKTRTAQKQFTRLAQTYPDLFIGQVARKLAEQP